jgi:hypothetical protein
LGGAVPYKEGVRRIIVKRQSGGVGGEERRGPSNDLWAVPEKEEEVEGTFDVNVIEETRNVEKDQGTDAPSFDAGLGVVDDTHCGIDGTMVVPAVKLVRVDEVVGVGLVHDASGDDLLQELTATL